MAVRVRLFAALRDAAGVAELDVEAGPLDGLLDDLCARYGDEFRTRLSISTVLVNGTTRATNAGVSVPDGAEVAILPPVSGGARR